MSLWNPVRLDAKDIVLPEGFMDTVRAVATWRMFSGNGPYRRMRTLRTLAMFGCDQEDVIADVASAVAFSLPKYGDSLSLTTMICRQTDWWFGRMMWVWRYRNKRKRMLRLDPSQDFPIEEEHALHEPDEEFVKGTIYQAMRSLSWDRRNVLNMRFGLGILKGRSLTLDECSSLYSSSREWIRQIDEASLKRLKSGPRADLIVEALNETLPLDRVSNGL